MSSTEIVSKYFNHVIDDCDLDELMCTLYKLRIESWKIASILDIKSSFEKWILIYLIRPILYHLIFKVDTFKA